MNTQFLELKKKAQFYTDYQAIGTEGYHRLTFVKQLLFTDGVADLAKTQECFWLMEMIASYYPQILKQHDDFLSIFFIRDGEGGRFYVTDGDDNIYIEQHVEYTDIKQDVKLYMQLADVNTFVVMLPSEY